jgi:hypothetical protein
VFLNHLCGAYLVLIEKTLLPIISP